MFHYVCILVSDSDSERHYIGSTSDLNACLTARNAGKVINTSKYKLCRVETAIAFSNKRKATAFERCLKSGSGRNSPDAISGTPCLAAEKEGTSILASAATRALGAWTEIVRSPWSRHP